MSMREKVIQKLS